MGFTALDGLVMSTRCGALDPGVILYLIDQYGMDVAELTTLLYQGSGLVGLSGLSGDMRTLLADPSPAILPAGIVVMAERASVLERQLQRWKAKQHEQHTV